MTSTNKDFLNLALFIGICFIAYVFFMRIDFKEGLVNSDASGNRTRPSSGSSSSTSSSSSSSSSTNGIAGNAATYAANIKAASVKLSDTLLVTKYRSDYESAIMNMEEMVNNLMLTTTLSADPSNPQQTLEKLVALGHAKAALNGVMKFVDSS